MCVIVVQLLHELEIAVLLQERGEPVKFAFGRLPYSPRNRLFIARLCAPATTGNAQL
jgi:hypothetical protein